MLAVLKLRAVFSTGSMPAWLGRIPWGLADLDGAIDFALAFAVVHEVPAAGPLSKRARFQGSRNLGENEPVGHVKPVEFEAELRHAASARLVPVDCPAIWRSSTALLEKAY